MILEGIVTTINDDGSVNISPMGPEVDEAMRRFVLKPYQSSTTYRNLRRSGQGVFHVTDDVELIARAAIGSIEILPRLEQAQVVDGQILSDACRWYAFKVDQLDDREPRTRISCEVLGSGTLREFFGFNRGKHAVLEAAILATRVEFLGPDHILAEYERLAEWVRKTGGPAEHRGFDLLRDFVEKHAEGDTQRPSPIGANSVPPARS